MALFGAQLKRKTLTNLFIFIAVWIRFKKIQISLPHLWANFIQHSCLILYAALLAIHVKQRSRVRVGVHYKIMDVFINAFNKHCLCRFALPSVIDRPSFIRELCNFSPFIFFFCGLRLYDVALWHFFGAQLWHKALIYLFIFIAVWIRFNEIQLSLPHPLPYFIQHSFLIFMPHS